MYANLQEVSLLDPYTYGIVDADGKQVDGFKFRWIGPEDLQLGTLLYADIPPNDKTVPVGTYTATEDADLVMTIDEK